MQKIKSSEENESSEENGLWRCFFGKHYSCRSLCAWQM